MSSLGPISARGIADRQEWLKTATVIDYRVAEILLLVLVGAGFSGAEIWELVKDKGIYIPLLGSFYENDFHYDCRPLVNAPGGIRKMKTRVARNMAGSLGRDAKLDRLLILQVFGRVGDLGEKDNERGS